MRFLVIDDSATMRRIIVNSLQRIGYADCVEASDGAEALRVFSPEIGVIITDWNMPGMTGVDFVRALRERPDGKTVPVLMVTTRSIKQDIVQAMQAGVNNYIDKPFTPQILKEKIETLLSGQPAIVS